MGEMRATFRQIPGAFDTSGAEKAFNNLSGMQMGQAQSSMATMAKAAQSRARQGGGQVAASFGAGSAMLPYFGQQLEGLADLEDYKLRAATSKMGLMADMAGQMGGMRQRQQGMMADFYNQGENRSQQGGQFDRSLAEQQRQFAAQMGLRNRQQAFEEDRYNDALSLQRSGGRGGGRGGGGLPSWGAAAAMMAAHNSALGNPSAVSYWQQMGQAAGRGGYQDDPVFGTGY